MKKITNTCPAKELLQLLGQPHVLTIIHTLADGVWGFNRLLQVTGINSRTLTLRLQMLQVEKIITSVDCPKDARCRYYRLATRGTKVNQILKKLDAV
jgi:DNA-binding HxlR family transcriptional regulator